MDTNTQIERLIELAIIQRTELRRLVDELPQLKEHLSAEIERTFEEAEPQMRSELEEFVFKHTNDRTAVLGEELAARIGALGKTLEESAQAKYSALIAERAKNDDLLKQAEQNIAFAAQALPAQVKEIVTAELARFPRAGEIDRLRKEFQEPRGLNPRGKWLPTETYNKLDLVTWNGDSYVSNTNDNKERPGRNAANWTLSAARGVGGGGPADLSALTAVPSNGTLLIGSGTSWVNGTLSSGAGISITVGPGEITISATDGDITLDDGTAASPSLHFTNDADTGIYRPSANTLGISVSGTQVAYFDTNGLTIPNAGVVAGGSIHAANGNANNPSHSFSGDQDTGFFRHQPNEIGIALGGTQYATLSSTTFAITPNATVGGNLTVSGTGDHSATIQTTGTANAATLALTSGNGTTSGRYAYSQFISSETSGQTWNVGMYGEKPFTIRDGSTAFLSITNGTGAATLAGNLTVSGTGTSSVAGPFSVGSASGSTGQNSITFPKIAGGSYANAFYLYSGNTDQGYGFSLYDITASAWRWVTTNSGNLLVGTTTDGGQKLQVNGSAKISGPTTIGAANGLTYLDLTNSGDSTTLEIENNTSGHVIVGTGSKSLTLKTNSTTALTLDSSQRCILAGALRLNNAYTASAVVPTGYVTIQDSTGTTYKVCVLL